MRKLLPLTIASLLITTFVNAQINKGSVLLGGNIGFGNSKNNRNTNYKENYVYLSPVIGVAVKTNLVAGVTVLYSHSKYLNDTLGNKQNNTLAGGSLFLRRYFPVAKNFYVYGQGSVGYSHEHSTQEHLDFFRDDVTNTISLEVAPGLAYAVSKKFHLELGLNNQFAFSYGKDNTEVQEINDAKTVKGNFFNFNTSFSSATPLYIGFRVLFAK